MGTDDLINRIRNNDLAGIQAAYAAGAKVNRQDQTSGSSLLTIAVQEGNAAIVRLLLELGADPNYQKTVTPPLSAAAAKGDVESLRALLDAGAKVDVLDEDGSTPLMDAAACGYVEIVQELLNRGANPKTKDRYGQSALIHAAEKCHPHICAILEPMSAPKDKERSKIIQEVKKLGRPAEQVMQLITLATQRDFDGVVRLVESGFPADAINEDGKSALMRAANVGHKELVQWLISHEANVNRKDVTVHGLG